MDYGTVKYVAKYSVLIGQYWGMIFQIQGVNSTKCLENCFCFRNKLCNELVLSNSRIAYNLEKILTTNKLRLGLKTPWSEIDLKSTSIKITGKVTGGGWLH